MGKPRQRTKNLAQKQQAQAQNGDRQQGRPFPNMNTDLSVKKATYEATKKRTVGVDDLCLLSKIANESINDNLKVRFENREIYVCSLFD